MFGCIATGKHLSYPTARNACKEWKSFRPSGAGRNPGPATPALLHRQASTPTKPCSVERLTGEDTLLNVDKTLVTAEFCHSEVEGGGNEEP